MVPIAGLVERFHATPLEPMSARVDELLGIDGGEDSDGGALRGPQGCSWAGVRRSWVGLRAPGNTMHKTGQRGV